MRKFDGIMVILRRFFKKAVRFVKEYDLYIMVFLFELSFLAFVCLSRCGLHIKIIMAALIALWSAAVCIGISLKSLELQISVRIPTISGRLTYRDGDGNICLDVADREKALIYLYELEEFIGNMENDGLRG